MEQGTTTPPPGGGTRNNQGNTPVEQINLAGIPQNDAPLPPLARESVPPGTAPAEIDTDKVQLLEYNEYENVGQMLTAAQILIDTGILPNDITEPEQVVGIMKYGHDLNISAMMALNNIHLIKGRPSLGVHLIAYQLNRFNIEFQLIEDLVNVQIGEMRDMRTTYRFIDYGLLKNFETKLAEYNQMDDQMKEIYAPIIMSLRNGVIKDVSYYWSQAFGAGLLAKDNWKDIRNMMRVRTLSSGARIVKPGALLGGYETTELAEALDAEDDIPKNYSIKIS